jgi:hypothetical protein
MIITLKAIEYVKEYIYSDKNDFKTIVYLVGFLFIVVIADAQNHEPEKYTVLISHFLSSVVTYFV